MPLKQGWNARISGQETQLEPRPRPCPGQLGSVAAALTGSRASEAEVGELNPGARTLLLPPHSGARITAPDTRAGRRPRFPHLQGWVGLSMRAWGGGSLKRKMSMCSTEKRARQEHLFTVLVSVILTTKSDKDSPKSIVRLT